MSDPDSPASPVPNGATTTSSSVSKRSNVTPLIGPASYNNARSMRPVIIASLSTPPKFSLMCNKIFGCCSRTRAKSGKAIAVAVLYGARPTETPPASARPTTDTSA